MNNVVIVYVQGGYKIDNGRGEFMYDGRAWNTLDEAKAFAEDEGLNYEII